MTAHVETSIYNAEHGVAWHGIGKPIPPEIAKDPGKLADLLDLTWTVQQRHAYYKAEDGSFREIPDVNAQVRSDNGVAFSLTSRTRYHVDNRQPRDILAGFVDELAAERMIISHAAALMGGSVIAVSAMLSPEHDLVVGKGDRIQRFATLGTGYDARIATHAFDGAIRVVCMNTWRAAFHDAQAKGTMASIRASTKLTTQSLKNLVANIGRKQEVEQRTYNEMANTRMTDADVLRYFANVLEVNVEDLDRVNAQGKPVVSQKMKNMLTTLTNAYQTAPGAAIASGSVWGALNAVTYYATHQKSVRDSKDDGVEVARVASNLYGDANRLKARALELALNRVKVAA